MKWCFTRYTVGKFWFLFLCLRVKHKSLFWVPILAAGGPYWVLISQKVGSLFQSLGVLISLGHSVSDGLVPPKISKYNKVETFPFALLHFRTGSWPTLSTCKPSSVFKWQERALINVYRLVAPLHNVLFGQYDSLVSEIAPCLQCKFCNRHRAIFRGKSRI